MKRESSESGETQYLTFRCDTPFSFLEGQFLMLIDEEGSRKKPYSIASTSIGFLEEGKISFYVKKASEEGMSAFLTAELQIGGTILCKGPLGHYVDPGSATNYLLVSTGSGLGPNHGLWQKLRTSSRKIRVINVFGERNKGQIIPSIIDEYSQVDQSFKGRYECHFFFSRDELPGWKKGYVQSAVTPLLEEINSSWAIFICGKPIMVEEVKNLLLGAGCDLSQITFEKY